MTPNETKPKVLKAADLRGIAALAADGKVAPQEAARIIEQYITGDRVKASLEAIRELRPYFTDAGLYAPIEAAFRKKNGLPAFDFDKKTAERSIEKQVWEQTPAVVPAPGELPVPLARLLAEYKLRWKICLILPRRPRKPKEAKEGDAK